MALKHKVHLKLGKLLLQFYLADNIFTTGISKTSREKTYICFRRVSFLQKDGNSHKMYLLHFFNITITSQYCEYYETGLESFAFNRVDFDDEPAEDLDV